MLSIFSKRHIKSSERIQAAHENKPIANINGARKCEQIVVGRLYYVACASRQEEHHGHNVHGRRRNANGLRATSSDPRFNESLSYGVSLLEH